MSFALSLGPLALGFHAPMSAPASRAAVSMQAFGVMPPQQAMGSQGARARNAPICRAPACISKPGRCSQVSSSP